MQSRNGGWGAFDADNSYEYLNNIPFSDHGALLDPPTADVSARCLSMLAQLGEKPETSPAAAKALRYLRDTQEKDGSWYGRWGMNYIYGTWSVLCALNAAGVDHGAKEVRKAADWLVSIQNADGGWGEDGTSYKLDYRGYEARREHGVANGVGIARHHGGRTSRPPCCRTRSCIFAADARIRRRMARGTLHRDRIPARLLSALSRLCEVFPALGAGALSQYQSRQRSFRRVRHVTALPHRPPVIAVTGLAFEARIAAGEGVTVIHGRDEQRMIADLERASRVRSQRHYQLRNGGRPRAAFGAGRLDCG